MFKEKFLKGEKCVGTFFVMGSTTAMEALSYTGMDFVLIDTEHGPYEVESVQEFIRTAKLSDMSPCVRVKDGSRAAILKMLDVGAEALIIPNIHTVEEVKEIVKYGKYYPLGQRGVALGRASGFGNAPFAKERGLMGYFETCNEETMLLPQCETKGCLENIEEIVAVEGVSGIFVGPYDLSVALDNPGKFDTEEFTAALDRVLKACKAAGKCCWIFAGTPEATKGYFEKGFDAVTLSTDIKLFITNLQRAVSQCR